MEFAEHDRHLARPVRRDSSLSSPNSANLTPESSESAHGDGEEEEEDVLADPLLRSGQEVGGEIYELREGVGKREASKRLDSEEDDYQDDDDDDADDDVEAWREDGEDDIVFTVDEERAVVRKFDRRLVLFVALLYLLSFLDRSSEYLRRFLIMVHHFFSGFGVSIDSSSLLTGDRLASFHCTKDNWTFLQHELALWRHADLVWVASEMWTSQRRQRFPKQQQVEVP